MSSTQTSASENTPINQTVANQGNEETTHYMYIEKEIPLKTPKTYDFIIDGETISITGHDRENDSGVGASSLPICPLDKDDHSMSDKNAKALKEIDEALYDTTYNFFHEDPNEAAVKIFSNEKGEYFDQSKARYIIECLVKDGHLPKTEANCGNLFKVVSLDAKLRSGENIVDSKIKNTDIVLKNGLFIRDLIIRNRIRIKKCVVQIDDWQVLCDSNDSFMNAITTNDAHGINLQPDTRIGYQLKALKERAEFIQANLDLEFESGSIKLDQNHFIIFKDNQINLVDKAKGKKKVISPFALFMELNDEENAPEILYNPEGLLKKGDNNNFVTLKYNQKRHDLSTVDGIRNRIMQTLSEAYNKSLKKDIDNLLKLVRAINNTTEDIDSIMSPWTAIKQSPEAQPKNKPNNDKPEAPATNEDQQPITNEDQGKAEE